MNKFRKKWKSKIKKFQDELAFLRNSKLDDDQIENTNQIDEDDDISVHEQEQQAQAWYKNQTDAIESAMADEKIDEKWTEETQQRLETALQINSNNMEVQNITCGGSICKLNAEIKGEDLSSGPDIDHLVYGDMEWDGPILSKYDADTGEVTVFLMRSGVEISDFEPDV